MSDEKLCPSKILSDEILFDNSIRNKLSSLSARTFYLDSLDRKSLLSEIVSDNIDVLIVQETKTDATFPNGQFLIPGCRKSCRRDRNNYLIGPFSAGPNAALFS